MGPPELPGGNRVLDYSGQHAYNGFNGAAGITRRKHASCTPAGWRLVTLQWGRRNYPAETHRRRRERPPAPRCFNGAAGITRRKLPTPPRCITSPGALQWGRRNYPAETWDPVRGESGRELCFNGAAGITRRKRLRRERLGDLQVEASMGPPELPGGNSPRASNTGTPASMLQWGRRNYPAETRADTAIWLAELRSFNGAAGITRRKLQIKINE